MFKPSSGFDASSRLIPKPALHNPFVMLHEVAILFQGFPQPRVLPVQPLIEENMCVSKDTRIEQPGSFLAKETFIISQ